MSVQDLTPGEKGVTGCVSTGGLTIESWVYGPHQNLSEFGEMQFWKGWASRLARPSVSLEMSAILTRFLPLSRRR